MIVTVSRVNIKKQIVEVGKFHDLYHPVVFLKALLDRDEENGKEESTYVINYKAVEETSDTQDTR